MTLNKPDYLAAVWLSGCRVWSQYRYVQTLKRAPASPSNLFIPEFCRSDWPRYQEDQIKRKAKTFTAFSPQKRKKTMTRRRSEEWIKDEEGEQSERQASNGEKREKEMPHWERAERLGNEWEMREIWVMKSKMQSDWGRERDERDSERERARQGEKG